MAIGKKLLDLVGFVDAEDENTQLEDDYHNDYYESYDAPVQTEERRFSPVSRFRESFPIATEEASYSGGDDMKIVLLQPMRFEEAQTITRYLLDNRVVVFDLHECQVEEAVNIVNFVSGAIFALNGSIQKINDRGAIFVAVPPSVSLENELRGSLNDGDYGPTIAEWVNHQRGKGDF